LVHITGAQHVAATRGQDNACVHDTRCWRLILPCPLTYTSTHPTPLRIAGLSATFWGCVHGVFTTFPALVTGWEWYVAYSWDPAYAYGQWEFAGQVAVVLQVIMVFFSVKYFRQKHYKVGVTLPFSRNFNFDLRMNLSFGLLPCATVISAYVHALPTP
jgi:hypothetical protein